LLSSPVGRFRVIAFVEGVSALLLFFVAMPIKYVEALGANPLPVRYVGWAHGVLVILFAVAGVLALRARRWGPMAGVYGFVAALVPFGTFVYDARFLKPEHDRERAESRPASGLQ
jgi:integral membrane protein